MKKLYRIAIAISLDGKLIDSDKQIVIAEAEDSVIVLKKFININELNEDIINEVINSIPKDGEIESINILYHKDKNDQVILLLDKTTYHITEINELKYEVYVAVLNIDQSKAV